MLRRIRRRVHTALDGYVEKTANRVHARNAELAERIIASMRAECDRAVRTVQEVEFRARRDIFAAGERHAVRTTERFIRKNLPTANSFSDPILTLRYALSLAPDEGMACEFGVFSGSTLAVIADARAGKDVYGFDSFQGLPEDWRTNIPTGTFRVDEPPEVPGAELVVGWFDDTLPDFLDSHPGPVAFLHLDADLYSSTKVVLGQVGSRLRPGSVVVFDEYFNYPGWEEHEHRAWCEFVEASGVRFEYLCYTSNSEQLAVRITEA
ncbi:class I SAM-dependent methyltransferase [Amycolatopsis pigmentata]|uniref:Class I SAM-dependent methyltransferase n=1 Tax=Amycolatopsis pigmentata TaxID=450801 RepID=A0ABW5FXC2_9PSEU